jgi:hypothetical protein
MMSEAWLKLWIKFEETESNKTKSWMWVKSYQGVASAGKLESQSSVQVEVKNGSEEAKNHITANAGCTGIPHQMHIR